MTIRSGLVVILRLFCILMIMMLLLWMLMVLFQTPGPDGGLNWPVTAAMGLLLLPCLLGYWLSGWIIDALAPKATEILPEPGFTVTDLQAVAFSAIGCAILFSAINQTVRLIFLAQGGPGLGFISPGAFAQEILSAAIAWAIGLYMLFGAPSLRRVVTNLRQAGPKPEQDM